MKNPSTFSIPAVSERLHSGQASAEALLQGLLDHTENVEPRINAFITKLPGEARLAAIQSDYRRRTFRSLGVLDGLALSVKDNIDVVGVVTTAGLKARGHAVASEDAEVVRRLRSAGMILVGKTNMDEAAMGGTTRNPIFGCTTNPWDARRTAGGSSGGAAAALSASMCIAALGTDTLGSTRIPASYCGVAAIKPTSGLISTRGVVPLCYRLDSVGLMALSVSDLRILLDVAAGYDPLCVGSAPETMIPDKTDSSEGVRIGVLIGQCGITLEPEIALAFETATTAARDLKWIVAEVALDGYDPARGRRAGLLLGEADASVTHSEILAKESASISQEIRKLMLYGRDVSGEKLARAGRLVSITAHQVKNAMEHFDALMTPTTPQTAFSLDAVEPLNQGDFTALANLSGRPAITIPMLASNGLPCGIQLIGHHFKEDRLLTIASKLESILPAVCGPHLPIEARWLA